MPESPTTLKALYSFVTGDKLTHQRRIHAHYLRLTPRRRSLIDERLAGRPWREIGRVHGVSGASAQSAVILALRALRKAIAGEPRYNVVGR